jgi:CIC family chloride channel protein
MNTDDKKTKPAATSGGSGATDAPSRPGPRQDEERGERQIALLSLSLVAVFIGLFTGFGAVAFRALIGLIHNLFFFGSFTFHYDANEFTATSSWGPLVILVPVIGGMGVTYLVKTFAPEARGHGVPEVMDAIYYREGVIRPIVAVVKSFASALSIGSGAAVGREGPIIQIGASFASSVGQILPIAAWQRITLVAAGAGAGIAATFNTPLGGVMFAIELMMPEVSVRTFLPVALATGTATFIGRIFLGPLPAFLVPPIAPPSNHATTAVALLLYAALGGVIGLAATGFIRGLHWAENKFDVIGNSYARHAVGMLSIGILMYVLKLGFGQYYIDGVGYSEIQSILTGQSSVWYLLLLLFVCKLYATSASLGSGASGGIFSPSLFMGATLGGGFGAIVSAIDPSIGLSVPNFAMVGMAAMVGGGTGAAMTAVVMIFEMTRDYDIVVPLILAVAVAIGVRRMLSRENIYTIKLVGRRHFVPKALHANMFLVRHANDVMEREVLVLPADMRFDAFLSEHGAGATLKYVVVRQEDRIVGVLRVNTSLRRDHEAAFSGVTLGDIAELNYTVAREEDIVFDVIARMWRKKAGMAIVTGVAGRPRADDVLGIISKEHIADSVAESVKPYAG